MSAADLDLDNRGSIGSSASVDTGHNRIDRRGVQIALRDRFMDA
jgi:hypothetical protein